MSKATINSETLKQFGNSNKKAAFKAAFVIPLGRKVLF
jgi:hypothetical protein